jgi:uncharacterized protein YyaL (SSP411 family)
VLLRLAHWTGEDDLYRRAEQALLFLGSKIQAQPTMAPQILASLGRYLTPPEQVVIRCQDGSNNAPRIEEAAGTARREYRPYSAVVVLTDSESQALTELAPVLGSLDRKGSGTLYRCRNLTCELPEQLA